MNAIDGSLPALPLGTHPVRPVRMCGPAALPGQSRLGRAAERIVLDTADGYPLVAMRHEPSGRVRARIVVAGATGVPQRFYRRFADFAARHGFGVLTLDYRGIGLSAPASLRGFRMDYGDWGRYDLAAGVAAMDVPGTPLHVVGHSYGGHGFGFLPAPERVTSLYTFGTGAGWHGWMPRGERLRVLCLWHLLGPVLTTWSGYLSWSRAGLGEDLPLDFYRQWKRWCRYPDFFFGDPAMRDVADTFARVRTPLLAANAIDDRWSPPASRDAFIAGYRSAPRETLDLDPGRVGLSAIGHLGYFRAGAEPLWAAALSWCDAR